MFKKILLTLIICLMTVSIGYSYDSIIGVWRGTNVTSDTPNTSYDKELGVVWKFIQKTGVFIYGQHYTYEHQTPCTFVSVVKTFVNSYLIETNDCNGMMWSGFVSTDFTRMELIGKQANGEIIMFRGTHIRERLK